MKITVIGCGRWGTFLAWYSNKLGHDTLICGRKGSSNLESLKNNRKNELVKINSSILMTDSLSKAVDFAQICLISIPAQNLRELAKNLSRLNLENKLFILCMKGLEEDTGKRLSTVFYEETGKKNICIWAGPGHVQNFVKNVPSCMVMGYYDINKAKQAVSVFSSNLIRFYYAKDIIGCEVGAAAKNVIGIAAGLLDGLGLSSLKGALMARGAREISRLVKAMGGSELTPYGLSHLGDYEATLFSEYSHNRQLGEHLAKGQAFKGLAEGVMTSKALYNLSNTYNVELPISYAVYSVLFESKNAQAALVSMFTRPLKEEFDY